MTERYRVRGLVNGGRVEMTCLDEAHARSRFLAESLRLHVHGGRGWASWSCNGLQGNYACSAGYVHGAAAERKAA